MTLPAFLPPHILAWAALALGAAGVLLVVVRAPRRSSPTSLLLFMAFGALAAGAALALRPEADVATWGSTLIVGGGGLSTVMAIVLIACSPAFGRTARLAMVSSSGIKREIERLTGVNVRLEDELAEARAKLARHESERRGQRTAEAATVRRQQELLERVQASERKQRSVIDQAFEGMATLERETLRFDQVNASLSRLTGYEADELAERSILDLFRSGPDMPGRADLQRIAREGRAVRVTLERKDDGVVECEVSVCTVGEGDTVQLLAILRDVTERVTMERELQEGVRALKERELRLREANVDLEEHARRIEEMNVRLEALQKAKDHSVVSTAHDFRAPMTSIRSFSEILLRHEDTDPAVRREFLEIINRESERMTRVLNDVLDLRRIETGEVSLQMGRLSLSAVVRDATAALSGLAASRDVTLGRGWENQDGTVRGDHDRLQQLISNLLANALNRCPVGGGVAVDVEPSSAARGPSVRITADVPSAERGAPSAADAGGDDSDDIVFESFSSAPAPAHDPDEELGLTLCREIAAAHGAELVVLPRAGACPIYTVVFPVSEPAASAPSTDAAPLPSPAQALEPRRFAPAGAPDAAGAAALPPLRDD